MSAGNNNDKKKIIGDCVDSNQSASLRTIDVEEDFICIISDSTPLRGENRSATIEPHAEDGDQNDQTSEYKPRQLDANQQQKHLLRPSSAILTENGDAKEVANVTRLLSSTLSSSSTSLGSTPFDISLNLDCARSGTSINSICDDDSYDRRCSTQSLNFETISNANTNTTAKVDEPPHQRAINLDAKSMSEKKDIKPPNELSKFERLQQWIYCIVVVNFDIEIGQSIENIFPTDAYLTERESTNICYLSFPDSNSGCMGDTQFHFRTKTGSLASSPTSRVDEDEAIAVRNRRAAFDRFYLDFNANALQTLHVDSNYLHGYVYFRQVKDRDARRGYFQKSLVILSLFPFVSLFADILHVLAPQFFDLGIASLEAACSDINRWPSPITGRIMRLPLLGAVKQVLIPDDKYNYAATCSVSGSSTSTISTRHHHPHHPHHHHRNHFIAQSPSLARNSSRNYLHSTSISFPSLSSLKALRKNSRKCANNFDDLSSPPSTTFDHHQYQHNHHHHHQSPSSCASSKSLSSHDIIYGEKSEILRSHLTISSPSVINVANDINIYRALLPVIAHVQALWELVLTCEPLAIIAQSPNVCSNAVTALVHCITPLAYGSDYRPFFTIHDSEFKEYTSQSRSPPPIILGVTNPFFVKTLADWPHLIKINDLENSTAAVAAAAVTSEPAITTESAKKPSNVNINSALKKVPSNGLKSLDMKTGVYTKYRPYLVKDREILKNLLKGIETGRPMEAQNALLRRFFVELTQTFLIPLERYFASLMPLAKNLSPFKRPPMLQHFKIEDFIATLNDTGPQLTTGIKGDWTGLYRRFLRSPNFVAWYHARATEADAKLRALHVESICDRNLVRLVHGKPEVEIVDLILKMEANICSATNGDGPDRLSASTVDRLRANMLAIIDVLPEDSRSLFDDNARRRRQDLSQHHQNRDRVPLSNE